MVFVCKDSNRITRTLYCILLSMLASLATERAWTVLNAWSIKPCANDTIMENLMNHSEFDLSMQ